MKNKIIITYTVKFRGAESIWPSGAKLLGICSNVKAVGTILLES